MRSLHSSLPKHTANPPPDPPGTGTGAPGQGVEDLVARVRRRQTALSLSEGALLCLAVLSLGTVVAAGAMPGFPALARGAILTAAAAGLALFVWRGAVEGWRHGRDPFRTARAVAQRVPAVSLDLLAALELRRALEAGGEPFSRELARAFLARTDQSARVLEPAQAVDRRPIRRAGGAALVALAVLATAALLRPEGFRSLATLARRTAGVATVSREPITGEIELTYQYPAYTGLLPRTVGGSAGEIAAPRGTQVQLRMRADRPVDEAGLLLNGARIPLTIRNGRDLSGSLVLSASGHYAVVFYGRAGREVARGPDLPVTAEPDAVPSVALLLPAMEIEVDPDQEVALRWDATDDHGLTELALVYQVAGGEERRLALPRDDGRRSAGQLAWNLGPLKLAAGDTVSYFVEAKDNDAVDGPQRGVSRTQMLHVYSAAEHRRSAIQRVEALWERMVGHLATRMEGPDRARQKNVEAVTAQGPVDEAGAQLANALVSTGRTLGRERDPPEILVAALANVGDGVRRRSRSTAEARRLFLRYGNRISDFDTSARLTRVAGEEIAELEKDVLYLESLLDRQKLDEMKELASQLARDQRELAQLIEKSQSSKDPAVKEQVLRQVTALRRRMSELMRRWAEMAKGIRDEHLNEEAIKGMAAQADLQSGMDEVEKLLRAGKSEEALAKLQQLQAQVGDLQRRLDETTGSMGEQVNPELVKRFREFSDSLKATTEAQKALAERTRALRDKYRQQLHERLKRQGGALRDQLRKEAEALAQDYAQVPAPELPARADRALEQVQSELDNLKSALKAEDYDLSADATQRAGSAADELARDGEQQRALDEAYQNPVDVRERSRRTAQRLAQDANRLRAMQRRLQQLFPPPGALISPEDRQRLQQQAAEQRGLEKKAQDLAQKMQQLNQMAPLFGEQGSEEVQSVGDRMAGASERLEGQDPGRGYGEQKAALDGLEQIQQKLAQSQKSGGKGGLPLPMLAGGGGGGQEEGGEAISRQKVEVPDQDPAGAPREFRKDLLDAMKQGAPERYREQVKQYYEELVK